MRTGNGVTADAGAGRTQDVAVHDVLNSGAFERLRHARVVYPQLRKQPQPVLSAEEPWEFHWLEAGRNSVLFDPRDGLFKMWYRAANPDHPERRGWYAANFLRCYATSEDGINWTRPSLGLFEHRGSKQNNIVDEYGGDGLLASVVLDLEETDPARRYKSIGFCDVPDATGVYTGCSADGFLWRRGRLVASTTRATDGAGLIGRHPWTGEWLAVVRPRTLPKRRFIGIATSRDFTTWSEPNVVLTTDGDDPDDAEFDSLSTIWVGGHFVGIAGVYHTHPDDQTYDGQLTFSHDGVHWHRPTRRPILALSPAGQWDDSQVRISSIVRRGDELYIYYSGANRGQGTRDVEVPAIGSRVGSKVISSSIGLARTPIHRFAAVEPVGGATCVAETRFISASGSALRLNADATRGAIRVQVRDVTGEPIPGLTFDDCVPVTRDGTDLEVRWKTDALGDHVGDTAKQGCSGSVIKLEFELKDSLIYAFHFGDIQAKGNRATP